MLKGDLRAAYEGRMHVGQAIGGSRGEWRRLALSLMRLYALPEVVEPDDVVQELQIGALRAFPRFDPKRSPDVARYVIFSAMQYAKKFLNRQRSTRQARSLGLGYVSVIPIPFSRIERRHGERRPEVVERLMGAHGPEPIEERASSSMLTRSSGALQPVLDALALSGGSVERAAGYLYSDLNIRRECRMGCIGDARRVVRRALRLVAARAA